MLEDEVLSGPSKLRVVQGRLEVHLGNDWRLRVSDPVDATKVRFREGDSAARFDVEKRKTSGNYLLIRSIPFVGGELNEVKYEISASKSTLIARVELVASNSATGARRRYVDLTASTTPHWTGYLVDHFRDADTVELVIHFSRRKGIASVAELSAKVLPAPRTDEGIGSLLGLASSLQLQPDPDSHPLLHYVMGLGERYHHTHPLFDEEWYVAQLPTALPEGVTPLEHYVRYGDPAGISPHPLFHPSYYRSQAADIQPGQNALIHYLTVGFHSGLEPHPLFRSQWYLGREDRLAFEAARKVLQESFRTPGEFFSQNPSPSPAGGTGIAQPAERLIVYTCLFGSYEALKPIRQRQEGVRYIVFTDDPALESNDWEIVIVNDRLSSTRRTSRLPKILAHRYLPDHDISLYIDSSLTLVAEDVHEMVRDSLNGADAALYPHHRRNCVYDEITVCLELGLERSSDVEWYRAHYDLLGIGRNAGLYENTLIVRRNNTAICELNELWWETYIGERDQLSLMSALFRCSATVATIAKGKQVRNNPYVTFTKHNRTSLPVIRPRTYVFVAYAPSAYSQDLGRAYNDYMEMVDDDDVVVFLDHDAMFCSDEWHELVSRYAAHLRNAPYLIIGRTNRIGNPYQRINPYQDCHDIRTHAAVSDALSLDEGDWATNVGQLNSSSGVILAVTKSTWMKHKFASGFLKVDNQFHISFRNKKQPVYMPAALYAYHFYRADGDSQHAVKLKAAAPAISEGDDHSLHRIRNCIYDEAAGLNIAHYAGILRDDQFGLFLRSDSMMCDKHWYHTAERMVLVDAERRDNTLWSFSNNLTDPQSPSSSDVLDHRAYASGRLRARRSRTLNAIGPDDLISFMCSAALLKRYVSGGGSSVAGLSEFVRDADVKCRLTPDIYVFTQNRQGDQPLYDQSALADVRMGLTDSLRVAILTLGFWPAQAGMEMMIHNLATHLNKIGDDVVLFAPHPEIDFVEIEHEYLLKRFKGEGNLEQSFLKYHDALPFDVLLVQGGYKAATIALHLKAITGVPVVLRTHGEDIQTDDETGYGYRLDPKKRHVIDANIRSVDRNVVIGDHIAPLINEIAPSSEVRTIYNGVDTERFVPRDTRFLHDRLGLSDSARIIITVGRNVKKKAFHLALQAFSKVLDVVPDAVLVHVGKEGNGEDLTAEAERLGISHAFYMTGPLDYFDTPLAYASAEVFVFPSKMETFGNVTLEAMSAGLPCVEFDYGANKAKIVHGKTGFIIPYGDVDGMAASVISLLSDDDLRTTFSFHAREHAKEKFSWPVVAGLYHKVLLEARSNKKASARALSALGSRKAVQQG